MHALGRETDAAAHRQSLARPKAIRPACLCAGERYYSRAVYDGGVAVLALLVNGGGAAMLYAYRDGDAIGNLAVMLAAVSVFGTGSDWQIWL